MSAVIVQDDQKILVIGQSAISGAYGLNVFRMGRLKSDGTVDTTFNFSLFKLDSGSLATTNATLDETGKIIIEGNGVDSTYILRYNADGTLDSSFNGTGGINLPYENGAILYAMAVQSDDKIITSLSGSDMKVMRVNADGTIDSTFGTDGIQTIAFNGTSQANAVAIQNDGKIIIGGVAANNGHNNFALARLNTDGSPDNSFNGNGKVTTDPGLSDEYISSLAIRSGGNIVVSGTVTNNGAHRPALASYETNGTNDISFNTSGSLVDSTSGKYSYYTCGAVQSDGKYVAAGTAWNGTSFDFMIARYNTNGSLDQTFSGGGIKLVDFGSNNDTVSAIVLQPDGKILVAGSSGNNAVVARLMPDGSLDATFNNGIGFNSTDVAVSNFVTSMVVQQDGKVLIGGKTGLLRYNADGTTDTGFGTVGKVSAPFNNDSSTPFSCQALTTQNNKRIVVSGVVYQSGFYNTMVVAGYKFDGSVDSTFGNNGITLLLPDIGASTYLSPNQIAIDSLGRILISGDFHALHQREDDLQGIMMAGLDSSGNLDNTFGNDPYNIGLVFLSSPLNEVSHATSLVLKSDNKILLGGYSSDGAYDNFSMEQLHENGSVDAGFGNGGRLLTRTSTGINRANAFTIYQDKLYAAGYGLYPDEIGVVARYIIPSGGTLPVTLIDFSATLQQNQSVLLQWQTTAEPNFSGFIIEKAVDGVNFNPIGQLYAKGNVSRGATYTDIDQQPNPGINYYRLKILDRDGKFTHSKVVSVNVPGLITFRVAPNPAHDLLFIQSKGITEKAIFEITSMAGQKLITRQITLSGNDNISIDINSLPKGIYNLSIRSLKQSVVRQFVKE